MRVNVGESMHKLIKVWVRTKVWLMKMYGGRRRSNEFMGLPAQLHLLSLSNEYVFT